MSRRPISETTTVSSRKGVWEAILALKRFTLKDIRREVNLGEDTVREYVKGLARAGFVARDNSPGPFRADTYVLIKPVKNTPRVRPDGTEVVQGNVNLQMWRAMKVLKVFDARDISVNASLESSPVALSTAKTYLAYLYRAGYLSISVKSEGGSHLTVYRVKPAMYTGPRPPMIQRSKRVWDANLNRIMWSDDPSTAGVLYGLALAIILFLMTSILFTSPANAGEKWSLTDKVAFSSFSGLLAADTMQTLHILHSHNYKEYNPVIRWAHKKAGNAGVVAYFAACGIGSKYIADWLPASKRKFWFGYINTFEIVCVGHNRSIGITFDIGGNHGQR